MSLSRMLLVLCCLLMLAGGVSAQSGNITLLTVSEEDTGALRGGTATLFLELRPGTGAIFIDSAPLTKLDTQISTRFAAQVACDFAQVDCSQYDFFYTIRAGAPLVGGPSAGAATAVLTVAMLKDLQLDPGTVMTGTINAGGLIGPVAGVPEKTAAAAHAGFTTVLVPYGNMPYENDSSDDNASLTAHLPPSANITVIEVSTLQEAIQRMAGYTGEYPTAIDVPESYARIMNSIAEGMCNRYPSNITQTFLLLDDYLGLTRPRDSPETLFLRGRHELEVGNFYSAASFCFGANQQAREQLYARLTMEERSLVRERLLQELDSFEAKVNSTPLLTLTDVETYVIVKERLTEARSHLNPRSAPILYREPRIRLARAEERLYSAQMWAKFFGTGTKAFDVQEQQLRQACLKKIAETEERIQYALLYFPQLQRGSELDIARDYYASHEYPLCIYQASKTKAEMELLLMNLFVDTANDKLVRTTLDQAQLIIARQRQEGLFPLMGYSYYEYARSLQHDDPMSALLYANYALEISNLDEYFPRRGTGINQDHLLLVVEGFILGVLVTLLLTLFARKPRKTPRKEESSREKR